MLKIGHLVALNRSGFDRTDLSDERTKGAKLNVPDQFSEFGFGASQAKVVPRPH
jgi:hypothetical protein